MIMIINMMIMIVIHIMMITMIVTIVISILVQVSHFSHKVRLAAVEASGNLGKVATDGVGTPEPNPKHLLSWCL